MQEVFAGAKGPRRDAVVLNAAGAIAAAGHARDLREGIGLAVEAIDTGAAGQRLEELVAFSRASGRGGPDRSGPYTDPGHAPDPLEGRAA